MESNNANHRFKGHRYITRGFHHRIPSEVQEKLWQLIDDLKKTDIEMDYLMVFELRIRIDTEHDKKKYMQVIEHTQQIPPYKNIIEMEVENPVQEKVFIISTEDSSLELREYSTAMLAEEY